MSKFRRSWRAFRSLSWTERSVLVRTLVLLPAATAGVRLLGYRRTQAWLVPGPTSRHLQADLPSALSFARIVNGAAPWSPLPANCLPRALVLCRLLCRRGLQAELRLGVGKPGGEFAAHAWVEHAGVALAEPGRSTLTFVPFSAEFRRSEGLMP